MKRNILFAAIAAMTALGLAACHDDDNNGKKPTISPAPGINLSTEQQEMVKSQNKFAWRMLGNINTEAAGKNLVCSPLSMTFCLGMVNTGAAGNTSDEITSTLGFGNGGDAMNQYCAKLMKELPLQDNTTTFNIANCVEVNKQYTLLKDYKKAVEDGYCALVENRDFSESGFKDYLNGWVSKQTQGMIPQLFDETDPTAVAYIVNALYFKGIWADKFDKANTAKADFTKADGSTVKVDMMHQTENFKYSSEDLYQALSLDYGNGAYAMQILLPAKSKAVGDVITAIQELNWKEIVGEMSTQQVSVYMPKFTIEYGGEMNNLLKHLGINTMFTSEADFSKFCEADVFISKVIQKAKIEVDEEGTKAAAATGTEMLETSVSRPQPVLFRADRPFVFVITEQSTGAISFMGVYGGE